ncbi:lipocalin family protein [Aestuariibacter salexigens]|uniref:lipocalin family protein n=1 Tax=Aestuariibacter salexigens TaxID=226010 RepID=UPI000552E3E6|nr:lipocalin family protein [Aestuariibacter salexigens]
MLKRSLLSLVCIVLASCTSVPENVSPINNFQLNRYLGTWYEIARLDHPFERGLEQISATYTVRDDGGIDVLNKGFDTEKGEWREAKGKAYFVEDASIGHLKVSFFGPFYASYVIAELDQDDYQYALVTGPDTDYMWILSRTPELAPDTLEKLQIKAKQWGFAVDELIFVSHQ